MGHQILLNDVRQVGALWLVEHDRQFHAHPDIVGRSEICRNWGQRNGRLRRRFRRRGMTFLRLGLAMPAGRSRCGMWLGWRRITVQIPAGQKAHAGGGHRHGEQHAQLHDKRRPRFWRKGFVGAGHCASCSSHF